MAVFKFVIGEKGKAYQLERDQKDCESLLGLKIGSRFDAGFLGLDGYELKVTGGTDKDGFPMKANIEGTVKRRVLMEEGTGFSGWKKAKKRVIKPNGLRKKKMMRGNTIDRSTAQINTSVVKAGAKPLEELVPKKEKKE
jgi:small subunit ribosomal protein S6e